MKGEPGGQPVRTFLTLPVLGLRRNRIGGQQTWDARGYVEIARAFGRFPTGSRSWRGRGQSGVSSGGVRSPDRERATECRG